jgi:Beta-lactamase enzyme family
MPRKTLRSLLASALLATLPAAHAALDGDADTDDHSINVPTNWWTYQNLTPSQLTAKMGELNARVVDVEVTSVSAGVPRMTVRLVADSGAYAVPGATFTWDKTQAQLESLLGSAGGRLIELERYDAGSGSIRYAAVYVPNAGPTARAWGWLPGRTKSEIQSWASANNQRIIDLDSYGSGSGRRWNAVLVANTGSDYKRWDWDVNQTLSQVSARLGSFQGRLVKIERQSDGKYSFVQVDNTGSNGSAWWHGYGFRSLTDVNNFAAQMGARPVDILRYSSSGTTYYDAVVIDNANGATRAVRNKFFDAFLDDSGWPVGIFEAYIKRIDTNETLVNLNASRPAEAASALKALHLLHAMKRVNAGDPLNSSFTYYSYPTSHPDPADACPDPAYETSSYDTVTTLETGLDMMMNNSDNRTTRGVVLRYGGFAPLNTTAQDAKLKGTVLRHDIGCAYRDPLTQEYRPSALRNDTTVADLAAIWIGVHKGTLLPTSSVGRSEFLESGNPKTGANANLQAIIDQEAAALGISASESARFGTRVRTWGKSGSYGTCLPAADDATQCGQQVNVASSAGLVALPIGGGPYYGLRYHGYGSLMSDVPVPSWDGGQAIAYENAWRAAHYEMFRSAVRSALLEW